MVNLDLLKQFLLKAKTQGYASSNSKYVELLNGSKEFIFEEPPFRYRDLYYGFNPFAGLEVVWHDAVVVWVMNYMGGVFQEATELCPPEKIYDFLKLALKEPNPVLPLRGPAMFKLNQELNKNEFTYRNSVRGDISAFSGIEKILWTREGSRPLYHMLYSGLVMDAGGIVVY